MKMQKVKIGDLVANPYRNIDDYPIDKEKVDLLVKSFKQTGFWGNINCRRVGNKFQIAAGHHRLAAIRKVYGNGTVHVIVEDMSNLVMLQRMVAENREEYGASSAYVEMESIQQTINAYGRGEIDLPEVPKDTKKEYVRDVCKRIYTRSTVAEALDMLTDSGQVNYACKTAFAMIDAVADGTITRGQVKGLSRMQAEEIVRQAKQIRLENERLAKDKEDQAAKAREVAENSTGAKKSHATRAAVKLERDAEVIKNGATKAAKDFAKTATTKVKSGDWSSRDVRKEANERKATVRQNIKKDNAKTARKHIADYASKVSLMISKHDKMHASMVEILQGDFELDANDTRKLQKEVDGLITRSTKFWDTLEAWQPKQITVKQKIS